MRLSQFILENLERILQRWETFARSLGPGSVMTVEALRDDVAAMLHFVAEDMETKQESQQQFDKSVGHGAESEKDVGSACAWTRPAGR